MNSTITTNKEDYKKHFTPNTVNWLESRGFDPEKIYKALNKENIDLNSIEKKLVSQKEKILQYNTIQKQENGINLLEFKII